MGAVSQGGRGGDQAERQCVICRARRARAMLLQAMASRGPAGRHSYVCIVRRCLLAAFAGQGGDAALHAQAVGRIGEAVGLARRAGKLRLGASPMVGQQVPTGAVLLAASDMAPRTRRQLADATLAVPHTSAELARAAGARRPVAAVLLEPSRHATQAAYWQQVWYETQPREGQGHIEVGQ